MGNNHFLEKEDTFSNSFKEKDERDYIEDEKMIPCSCHGDDECLTCGGEG